MKCVPKLVIHTTLLNVIEILFPNFDIPQLSTSPFNYKAIFPTLVQHSFINFHYLSPLSLLFKTKHGQDVNCHPCAMESF
jgi:hypothetical protein